MGNRHLTHEPGCAAIAAGPEDDADWDDETYRAPTCTCGAREREKKRREITRVTGRLRFADTYAGQSELGKGSGCYLTLPLRSQYS